VMALILMTVTLPWWHQSLRRSEQGRGGSGRKESGTTHATKIAQLAHRVRRHRSPARGY
jgi:hypothetical protein